MITTVRTRAISLVHALLTVLVGLVLVVAGVLVGTGSAAAQNAVGASTPVMINIVGSPTDIAAGQRLRKTVTQPRFVVATGVAAEGGLDAGSGLVSLLRGLDWADDPGSVRIPGSGGRLSNSQAAQMAVRGGYRPTNYMSRGERVFTNGKTLITQDTAPHMDPPKTRVHQSGSRPESTDVTDPGTIRQTLTSLPIWTRPASFR